MKSLFRSLADHFYLILAVSALAIALGVGGCTEDRSISNEPAHVIPECKPEPVSDAGGDQWIIVKPDMADFVNIGTPEVEGTQYEWAPKEGLDTPKEAVTIARPQKKTVYTLTAKNRCGVAKSSVTVHVLKETAQNRLFTVLSRDRDGKMQRYHTGYNPDFREHYRVQYLHMPKTGYSSRQAPEELDLTPSNFHVNRQPNGSCWAEGARSAAEAGLNYIMKKRVHVSTQRIIDCSGFGSAKFGGQISIDDFLAPNGVVYEADYPYTGYDAKCKDAPFREQAARTYIVRNEDGGRATWPDIKNALAEFGMMEVCGSAGALGDGGWDSTPNSGAINHCWAAFGYLRGEKHGEEAGDYVIYQNSWGTNWGGGTDLHPGQGAYRVAPNGVDIKGSLLAENKVAVFENPCPPPIADGGPDKTILQIPGTPQAVKIGTPAIAGQTYSWSPADNLDHSDIAQPIAKPQKTTVYTVTVKNSCATVSSKVTVRVYADTNHGPVELK
jgi:hypothetical protein